MSCRILTFDPTALLNQFSCDYKNDSESFLKTKNFHEFWHRGFWVRKQTPGWEDWFFNHFNHNPFNSALDCWHRMVIHIWSVETSSEVSFFFLFFVLQRLFVAWKDFFFLNSWFRSFLLLFSAEHFQFWAILGCLAGTICLRFTHTVLMVFRSGELWGLFQKLQFALLHDGF